MYINVPRSYRKGDRDLEFLNILMSSVCAITFCINDKHSKNTLKS